MHNSYLLLTPFLTLLVVALVGFVGCDLLFGLDRVDDPPPPLAAPSNVTATPGDKQITVSWDPYPDATSMSVKYGTMSGALTDQRDLGGGETQTTFDNLVNGTTYYFVVYANVGSRKSPESDEIPATPSLPSGLTPFVRTFIPGMPKNMFSGWAGMMIQVGTSPLIVKTLGRAYAPGNNLEHQLKIVDASTGTDIPGASTPLMMTAGNVGEFQFASLPGPVTLNPGTAYYILSHETNGGDQYFDHDSELTMLSPGATVVASVYGDFGSYTTVPPGNYSYGPVNFQY